MTAVSILPEAVLTHIARFLHPPEPPLPPLRTPAGIATLKGLSGAKAAALTAATVAATAEHAALRAAAWAPLAAMRATCKEWCACATRALRCPPDWLPPDKALAPPGRWRGAPLTALLIAVPGDVLDREADADAWQAGLRQQLQQLYPRLQTVRWHGIDMELRVNDIVCKMLFTEAYWSSTGSVFYQKLPRLPRLVVDSVLPSPAWNEEGV